jgi:hypothetical protein
MITRKDALYSRTFDTAGHEVLPSVAFAKDSSRKAARSPSSVRSLTVCAMHREWSGTSQHRHATVPALRVNGNWLRAAGFPVGTRVMIEIRRGILTIRALQRAASLAPSVDSNPRSRLAA